MAEAEATAAAVAAAMANSETNNLQSKASRFADVIAKMPWKCIIPTTIKINGKWKQLIHINDDRNRKCLKCNLCDVVQYGSIKNIIAHIAGKKHKIRMNDVAEISNPNFTPQIINLKEPLSSPSPKKKNAETKSVTTLGGGDNGKNTDNEASSTQESVEQNKSVDSLNSSLDVIIIEPEKPTVAPTSNTESSKDNKPESPVAEEMVLPNPFSQANSVGGGEIKISCVSMSKLVDEKNDKKEGRETADVIEISDNDDNVDEKSPNQQDIKKQKVNKNYENLVQPQNEPKSISSLVSNPTNRSPSVAQPAPKGSNIQCHLTVPPARKTAELIFDSDRVDNMMETQGFLGVEYVIKILKRNDFTAPRYECTLCELILMGQEMQKHLLGYNHRMKYCQKHFPTAIRQYQQYMTDVPEHEIFKVMTPVLEKLAIAIEKHHGKFAPYKCYSSELDVNRHDIFSKVYARRHASEQHGPTFTHVLDAEEIRFIVQNRNNLSKQTSSGINPNQVSGFNQQAFCGYNQAYYQFGMPPYAGQPTYPPNAAPVLDNETHKMMVENFLKETRSVSHESLDSRRQQSAEYKRKLPGRSDSVERKRSRNLPVERKPTSPLRDGDIWQAYRHMVDIKVYDLDKKYVEYKRDPEQHPRYNEEWQKFWKRRKDELIRSGIDHRSYNYQNEWSIFFKNHMSELYKQSVEDIKIQCRERLILPMTNNELFDPKYHVTVCNDDNNVVDDNENNFNVNKEQHLNRLIFDNTNTDNDQNNTRPDIIHVLRILAALEEHLGSLGPKITEMLSKALLLSKFSPDHIEKAFLTRANCITLETCKEKFRGLLFAGVTDLTKERALNKAISETDVFLQSVMPKLIAEEKNAKKLSVISQKLSDVRQILTPPPPLLPATTAPTRLSSNMYQDRSSSFSQSFQTETMHPSSSNISQTQDRNDNSDYQKNVPSLSSSLTAATPNVASTATNKNQQQGNVIANDLTDSQKSDLAATLASSLMARGKGDFSQEQIRKIVDIYFAIINKKGNESLNASSGNEVNQSFLLNTIVQSFVNQNQNPNQANQQMTNANRQQQQQQQPLGVNQMANRNQHQRQQQQPFGIIQMANRNQQQQQQQSYGGGRMNTNIMTLNEQQQLQEQIQQQFQIMSNIKRNAPNSNQEQQQQQQRQQQSNNLMPNNMNYKNQSNSNTRASDMTNINRQQLQQQQYASQHNNNIMPNNMIYQQQQQQQQQKLMNMRGPGSSNSNLPISANANALPDLMSIRNINMNTISNEQNQRQNVPSSIINNYNKNNNNNFQHQSQGFGGNQGFGSQGFSGNRGFVGGTGGANQGFGGMNRSIGNGGGAGAGTFNQQMQQSFMNNPNNRNNNNNPNNDWSRMMNSGAGGGVDGSGNNQPFYNSNQFRGRNSQNMNNTERQHIWDRN